MLISAAEIACASRLLIDGPLPMKGDRTRFGGTWKAVFKGVTGAFRDWTSPASQIRNPKSQIGRLPALCCVGGHRPPLQRCEVQFAISDFGFEVLDSSNFEIFPHYEALRETGSSFSTAVNASLPPFAS